MEVWGGWVGGYWWVGVWLDRWVDGWVGEFVGPCMDKSAMNVWADCKIKLRFNTSSVSMGNVHTT